MKNIISFDNGITLSNDLGSRLEIFVSEEGLYGLGTFYFNDIQVGGCVDEFLREDNHYVWDKYQATRYEVKENSPERGIISFYGTLNGLKNSDKAWGQNNISSKWIVSIELTASSPAYRINLKVEPYLWPGRYHPLYVPVPFYHEHLECVSYPMEAPLLPPYDGHWIIKPDVGKVPLLLARERLGNKCINVGVGYSLDYPGQDYAQGSLWYDSCSKENALRIDFPYHHYFIPAQASWDAAHYKGDPDNYFLHGEPYTLDMVLSIAESQADCVYGYKDMCGYNSDTVMKHDVMDAVKTMLYGYKTDVPNIYEKGKGYRMRAWADSDELANYYAYITFMSNSILCYLLYKLWMDNKEETWARDRVIEMTEFAISKQIASGAMPRCWDVDLDIPHGMGDNYQDAGFVYDIMTSAIRAQYTDQICDLMEQCGDTVPEGWREYIQRCIDWCVQIIEKEDGYVRGTYNAEDIGVMNGIEAHALFGLRYFYQKTGDKKYLDAMIRYEDRLYELFGVNNDWYDGILDSNNFREPYDMPQPRNYYTLNLYNLAGYFHDRYLDTGDEKYLKWAEDNFAFGWMGRMPVNMEGYSMQTKGVIEEQNVWVFYDLPWPFNSSSGLARMAKTTKNRFYAELYKLSVNTQLEFAHLDKQHPFCSQVLGTCTDKRAPANRFAEIVDGKHGIWLTGYSTLFVYDMLEPYSYYFLGGPDWALGIDYEPEYSPKVGDREYIVACNSRVLKAVWEKDNVLCLHLGGHARPDSKLVLSGEFEQVKRITIDAADAQIRADYCAKCKELTISFDQPEGIVDLKIYF